MSILLFPQEYTRKLVIRYYLFLTQLHNIYTWIRATLIVCIIVYNCTSTSYNYNQRRISFLLIGKKKKKMGGFENYKPAIAMVGLQFSYAAVSLSTRVALLQGMSPRIFVVYRQAIATLVIAPIAYFSRYSKS